MLLQTQIMFKKFFLYIRMYVENPFFLSGFTISLIKHLIIITEYMFIIEIYNNLISNYLFIYISNVNLYYLILYTNINERIIS